MLCVTSLQLEPWELRPYSVWRGGATWWFGQHGNLDRVMVLGRWQGQKTARLYLNESRAILAEMQLGPLEKTLAPYRIFFQNSNPRSFETLEPLPSNRPSSNKRGLGGLGRKRKTSRILKKQAAKREKKLVSFRTRPGFGVWPTWSGGAIVRERPLPRVVDREGGGTIFSTLGVWFFGSQFFIVLTNLLQSE